MNLPETIRRAMLWLMPVAGAAALVSALAAAGCGRPVAASGTPVPAAAIPQLTALAQGAAADNGDANPEQITVVLTTRARALTSASPGDYVPGSAHVRVFLITMRGHFIARDVSVPYGASAPTGSYMSLVVDARTLFGLDFSIGSKPPPVRPDSLGPVTELASRGLITELSARER